MSPIAILRRVALWEGVSFLLLLGIAMPLKYVADLPEAVRVVGMLHGVLFVAFCLALGVVHLRRRWTFVRTMLVFLSSLVPFGTFVADKHLRRWQAEAVPA